MLNILLKVVLDICLANILGHVSWDIVFLDFCDTSNLRKHLSRLMWGHFGTDAEDDSSWTTLIRPDPYTIAHGQEISHSGNPWLQWFQMK